jgi:hypothetical protein
MDRPLTHKEQLAIQQFEKLRPGSGQRAEKNIRNNHLTGWADIIAQMTEEEIKLENSKQGVVAND